ncbi:MAG: PAS domain S-box protein [Proteobacteria bacterium]|uniref:MHYT domain-containing protein n=1 Tax=Aquabacterium sp. TaxID=1872578 RepID=UPI0035C6C73A|nr:PAS domain S-box protein [Pseudomonadota bacterium]
MNSFFWVADLGFDRNLLLYGEHDPWLVLLSVAIAIFTSSLALQAAVQARQVTERRLRSTTLLAGSLALGCGVWAMHFIGMLAFRLCTQVSYDTTLTTLSVLPSLGASWVALNLLSQERVSTRQLLVSGVLMGAGIGAMHYAGMAAMRMAPVLRYDPWMFALSIVVAVGLAVLALRVRFGLAARRIHTGRLPQTAVAGSVMGLAIASMHYTGMAAARFIGRPTAEFDMPPNNHVLLALSITLVTFVIGVLVAAAVGLARYRQLLAVNQGKEARLRAITDTSLDAIVVFDAQGTVHEINPGAERIYGRSAASLIGHSVTEIMVEPYRSMATDSFQRFLASIRSSLGVPIITHCEHADGHTVPLRLVIGRMEGLEPQMYVAFASDISEPQRMERALRDSEAQFRSLISNIPGISYRCRMEQGWPMEFISDAAEHLTGWPPAAFLGKTPQISFSELVSPADAERIADVVKQAAEQEQQFVLEFPLRSRDGQTRWMWGNGSLVRAADNSVKWIDGVLLDITERRQMENELVLAKEHAEAAAQARSTFLANMSHEIRTPMNAILGFTEVVLNGDLQAAQRKHLETVHKSARSLLHLLNDILDTSKLERGALELESLDFSLSDLVQQLCAEQSIQAGRKNLVLRNALDSDVGEVVRGDPHRLRQVLLNLLGNAIKFTEQGEVVLSCRREGPELHFTVRDTGIGIAPERLSTIFEAFTQADASMSRRFGGTGLGTTISKQLTELMGGRIWVESTVGQGSTFHVMLPLPVSKAAAPAPKRSRLPVRLPPLRVLVVDDVPQNAELLSVVMGRQGHTVVMAANGQEALDRYHEQAFDVVLMDVQMPVMDGLSACRAIRSMEARRHSRRTPVIALSASVQEEDRKAALAAGMDGFAHKPLDLAELSLEISQVTGIVPLTAAADAAATQGPGTAADAAAHEDGPLLVDVAQGQVRWGDLPSFQRGLRRFAEDQARWLDARENQQAPDTLAQAHAAAHRLRGAAANLGLDVLAQAARQVEACRDDTPSTQRGQAWLQMCQALGDTLAVIQDLMPPAEPAQGPSPAPHPMAAFTPPTAAPLAADAEQHRLWRHQAQRLGQAFQRGECLEPLFSQFCDAVRPHATGEELRALQALERANDDFDFEAAAKALARLTDGLTADRSTDALL